MIRLLIIITSLITAIGILFLPTDTGNGQSKVVNNRKNKKSKKGSED
ncbi:hypothetical protein [Companilactobacillus sp. HBUAS59699]